MVATGPGRRTAGFTIGDRAGAAWLPARTDGTCRYCARGAENLCPASALHRLGRGRRLRRVPHRPRRLRAPAPARVLRRRARPAAVRGHHRLPGAEARRPAAGRRLGLYGFGGSAHLAAQVALAQGATLSRDDQGRAGPGAGAVARRRLRRRPGGHAARAARRGDPLRPRSATWCCPRWPRWTGAARWPIAGIYLTDIPPLSYDRYLFQERQLRSVTSNTRQDAREFLAFAAAHRLSVTTHEYPLDAADRALADLKAGRFDGAAVLIP